MHSNRLNDDDYVSLLGCLILSLLLMPPVLSLAGCAAVLPPGAAQAPIVIENPSLVSCPNPEFVWEQIVDVVDDYFRIQNEEQVHLVGDVWTDGSIDTFPQGGATLLEPHRGDSVGRYNRWESTLQSIRRHAHVRVTPVQEGFLVDVVVVKDIEDLPRPEHATAGASMFRTDTSPKGQREQPRPWEHSLMWIEMGRDVALEQQILTQIHGRIGGFSQGVPY